MRGNLDGLQLDGDGFSEGTAVAPSHRHCHRQPGRLTLAQHQPVARANARYAQAQTPQAIPFMHRSARARSTAVRRAGSSAAR